MRREFGFTGFGLGNPRPSAPTAPAGPAELFPDPNLEDVADATNGWVLSGDSGAVGGTGPGIEVFGDPNASLVGANETAFNASVANNSTKTVAITTDLFADDGTIAISMKGGTPVLFNVTGSGIISQSVTAGTGSGFAIEPNDPGTFSITHISVT